MTESSTHFEKIGQRYKDFEVTKCVDIPELQSRLIELVHLPTNAQVLHIANEDPENLFCLSFQTLPTSSNGVAHILEHTVLCGSEKFPVKDPFFAMTRRSLNTFMNALTGSDFTCYPAATQNKKDFYNLLEVYLDAVFHPKLHEMSFLQEGHRLELSDPADPDSPLEFKGIVFNEMKGALSSSGSRLYEVINREIYPQITYGVNSGGDPRVIPQLTYEELKDFHTKHYHPSRCLFFFYGNLPLEEHLDFITKNTLNLVSKQPPLPPLPLQPRFEKPKKIVESYPISPEEDSKDKTLIAFAWLTCPIDEQLELLALCIIDIILLDTDASPLKLALLKSGLCKQVGTYMETDNSEVPFVVTLRGCEAENADALEAVLRQTLEEVVAKGIPYEQVENALHQLEFHRSEITGDHSPFGLSLFMRSALLKQHGVDAELGLHIHSLFEQIHKKNLETPAFFTNLIRKHLLDNPHHIRVVLQPDNHMGAREVEEEKAVLEKLKASLTGEEITAINQKAAELVAFQERQKTEDADILPTVSLEDVSKFARTFALEEEKAGPLHVFSHTCFTNDIIYADLIFDLPALSEQDQPYVRLFANLFSQMGCGGRSYAENLEYIQANTGGIGASLAFNMQAQDHTRFFPSLYIRGKALNRKAPQLFKLIKDMAVSLDFSDVERLKEVIQKYYIGLQSSLNQNAMRYAVNLSASGLDVASKIADEWYGLPFYWKVKELAENFDTHAEAFIATLNKLKQQLLCLDNPHLVLSGDKSMLQALKDNHYYGLVDIPTKPHAPWTANYPVFHVPSQGRIIASPVAFTAKVFKTVSYTHPDAAALNVAAYLFDNLVLHTRIREQGGAYGAGAISNSMSGNFYFYAYRDPNIVSTLNAFEEAVQEIGLGNFEDSDLEEAKLEMIQGMDSPIAPGSRGDLAYGWMREGKTLPIRQAFRDRLLSLNTEDILQAINKHVIPAYQGGATVSFAGKELLEKENLSLQQPLLIDRI
jgi:Zn-dependent M16 (insulinase) family peptidase